MTTPNRTNVWPPRWLTTLRLVAVLACLLVVVPAAGAQPLRQHDAAPAAASSLGQYLNPDGTLALPPGQALSLDAGGYRLVSGSGEPPRFAPAGPEVVPGNENWARHISVLPGTDGSLYAIAVDQSGHLYIGGDFTVAGGSYASRIAQWDGEAWSSLSSDTNSAVFALATDSTGRLFAGGSFTTIGGVSALHIARWDGAAWSAGGVNARNVARWNGASWSALGSGLDGYTDYWRCVRALAVDGSNNLYAGGTFALPGGSGAHGVARWDGTSWSRLGSGIPIGYYNHVYALAVDQAGYLYAGGIFEWAGGAAANYVTRWDGSAWTALGSGMGGGIYPHPPAVYAVIADTAGHIYAGGIFTTAGDRPSRFVARWTAADAVTDVAQGTYTLYAGNLPVTIDVTTLGTLKRLTIQRFDRSHPQATPDLDTGCYWEITATDANGYPASGYIVDLTLSTTFLPDDTDQLCRFTGSAWDCAASLHTPDSITRRGVNQLSAWTVANHPGPAPTPTATPTRTPTPTITLTHTATPTPTPVVQWRYFPFLLHGQ